MPPLFSAYVLPAPNGGYCETRSLRLSVSQTSGDRSRITVFVRNAGRTACDLGKAPDIHFTVPDGVGLPLVERNPFRGPDGFSLGHGPVMPPIQIRPRGVATTTIELPVGAEQPNARCVDHVSISLHWQSTLTAPLPFRVCIDGGGQTYFNQTYLRRGHAPAP